MGRLDLDEDWATLGKPSPAQLARREFFAKIPETIMGFINRSLAWIEMVIFTPFRVGREIVVWLFDMDHWMGTLIMFGAAFLVALAAYCLVGITQSDGSIRWCYIEMIDGGRRDAVEVYALRGHRDWKNDVFMRQSKEFEVLRLTAEDIGCPLSPHGEQ